MNLYFFLMKRACILFTQEDENGNPVHRSSFIVHRFLRMKTSIFYLWMVSLSFCSIHSSAQSGGTYHLVWQDLFDDGALNPSNWNIEVNGDGGGNSELQYYRAENVSVGTEPVSGKSCLVLTAKKESFGGKTATSGRINTNNKMSFKHGKIEASIRLPRTANGLWPAFWMLGSNYNTVGWPKSGEIDILEVGEKTGIDNGTQDRYFSGACHWGESSVNHPYYAVATTNSYSLQDDFHLFTLIWDNSSIKMYLDLDKYPNASPYYAMDIVVGRDDPAAYLHKPFFVLFNLAVGGNFPQIWNINQITALNAGNGYEAKMYVDFVKIYQKGESDEEFHGPTLGGLKPNPEAQTQYTIHPNPLKDEIRISGPETPLRITLFSLTGRKIREFDNTNVCNASGLSKGSYLVRIEAGEDIVETLRMIKE
jgi:beta-glucanase (GH16 family)